MVFEEILNFFHSLRENDVIVLSAGTGGIVLFLTIAIILFVCVVRNCCRQDKLPPPPPPAPNQVLITGYPYPSMQGSLGGRLGVHIAAPHAAYNTLPILSTISHQEPNSSYLQMTTLPAKSSRFARPGKSSQATSRMGDTKLHCSLEALRGESVVVTEETRSTLKLPKSLNTLTETEF